MTSTIRLSAEHILPGKRVVIIEKPRNTQGFVGTRGELTEAGQTITLTAHDGNDFIVSEIDVEKKDVA